VALKTVAGCFDCQRRSTRGHRGGIGFSGARPHAIKNALSGVSRIIASERKTSGQAGG
jgi:hypothetical protein